MTMTIASLRTEPRLGLNAACLSAAVAAAAPGGVRLRVEMGNVRVHGCE